MSERTFKIEKRKPHWAGAAGEPEGILRISMKNSVEFDQVRLTRTEAADMVKLLTEFFGLGTPNDTQGTDD